MNSEYTKNLISVIICTYNRCESLKDTLNGLLYQKYNKSFDYEVIVVDNNSKDKTKEVVKSFMPRFKGKLKYIFEKNQGKSYALNRGIKESKGEILAFIDDDCIPEERWLLKIYNILKKNKDIDGLLGKWEPEARKYENIRINAFKIKFIVYNHNLIFKKFFIHGANMSFRKNIFNDVGLFDVILGPGSKGLGAEDADFVYRAVKKEKKIIYCFNLIVFHKKWEEKQKRVVVYRDSKAVVLFLMKHILFDRDLRALKKLLLISIENIRNLFSHLIYGNSEFAKEEFIRLKGRIAGLISSFNFWFTNKNKTII